MKMALMDACISPADNDYEEVDDQYDEYALIIDCMEKIIQMHANCDENGKHCGKIKYYLINRLVD